MFRSGWLFVGALLQSIVAEDRDPPRDRGNATHRSIQVSNMGISNIGKCPSGRFRAPMRVAMTKTDAPSGFEELAENYRREAQVCRRMAALAGSSQKKEWLRLSAEWIRLANEADAMLCLT